jgi:restriction system protein
LGLPRRLFPFKEEARSGFRRGDSVKRRFTVDKEGLPDLAGMMLATIEALRMIGSSATIQELDEKVIELEGVSEEEQSYMMAGSENRPRVNYYLAWARTFLKRGSALQNSARGVWSLTDKGMSLDSYSGVRAIYEQVQQEERERTRQKRLQAKAETALSPTSPDDEAPELLDSKSGPEGEENWKSALLSVVGVLSAGAFERLSQRLLRESGFIKVEVRGKSGDGGIDGVGVLRVNLVSFQVYFQCKKWKGSVGAKEIRDFRGAMQGRADKGLFITTGHFTSQASDEATRAGAMAIDLIDGDRLCDLLKEKGLGITTETIERVKIDAQWFEAI